MAEDMTKLIAQLNNLVALDIDAVNAYEVAVERIKVMSVREQLREFQSDHRRHVQELSNAVTRLGGTPRSEPDIKGFFIKGFTAISSTMGDEAALRAMKSNEQLTTRTYEKALAEAWPNDVRPLIEQNYHDEQRHLSYVEDLLRDRSWARGQPARP
jgi:uncharacterized protein (TIGR02284 family)